MKKTLLTSLLLGCCSLPMAALAGGIEVQSCCVPPRVDIPDLRPGWGFLIEGAALRGFNNNLNYFASDVGITEVVDGIAFTTNNQTFEAIDPVWAFALKVGVNYTLANSGNILRLYYEHLFDRQASASDAFDVDLFTGGILDGVAEIDAQGTVRQELDGITLVSEQHILIGPFWETTLTGGVRFAHLEQEMTSSYADTEVNTADVLVEIEANAGTFNMQFNGVGPTAGLGTIFHVTPSIAFGAEALGALLMGRNTLDSSFASGFINPIANDVTATFDHDDDIYSIVPEMYYRIYGNYFYQFTNGSQLQIEAGWRANQFFNVRTFNGENGSFLLAGEEAEIAVDTTTSDDIGFSGPYLTFIYNL